MKSNKSTKKVGDLSTPEVIESNSCGNRVWSPNSSSRGCCERSWKTITRTEKSYWAIITLLLLSLIVIGNLFVYYVIREEWKLDESRRNSRGICLTKECVKASASILDRMDFGVNPCTDFYAFSCGNFVKTKQVPDDHSNRNILQEMQDEIYVQMKNYLESPAVATDADSIKKLKSFYLSCINDTAITDEVAATSALLELLQKSGGSWRLLETALNISNTSGRSLDEEDHATFNTEHRIFSAFMHQIQSIFHISVQQDRNLSFNILHFVPGQTILEGTYLINASSNEEYAHYFKAYADLQLKTLSALAAIKGGSQRLMNRNEINRQLYEMFLFEADLANITKNPYENGTSEEGETGDETSDESSNSTKKALKLTLEELQRDFAFIEWDTFLQYIEKESQTKIDEIMVENIDYFYDIAALFKRHSRLAMDNYFCWAVTARYLPYLGTRFRRFYADFRREVPDISPSEEASGSARLFLSRWKECVHVTCEGLKLPSSLLYLTHNKHHIESAVVAAESIVKEIKDSFFSVLDKQSWLQNTEIKEKIKDRVREMRVKVGFPDFVNSKESDNLYKNLHMEINKVFLANIIKMAEHETHLELKKLKEEPDPEKEWLFNPLITNAFFETSSKFIILPAAILRYPLLAFGRPIYLDYATLGVVIGHEIAHSFYTEMKRELSDEKIANSPLALEYNAKSRCFAQQFSAYSIEKISEPLNGNLTLEENICDYAGLQQAYTAYRKIVKLPAIKLPGLTEYSADQLFFIQYAQVWCEIANDEGHRRSLHDSHAPGQFRANGMMVNTEQFASAFNCTLGSPMNPEKKCKLLSVM